ncbi:MAG: hypothetical protein E6Q97_32345 [Desulfurellales bacterium]|nr:MAG: hypothetical protein E6Q97_32345 [Desulfurellales bacterium]
MKYSGLNLRGYLRSIGFDEFMSDGVTPWGSGDYSSAAPGRISSVLKKGDKVVVWGLWNGLPTLIDPKRLSHDILATNTAKDVYKHLFMGRPIKVRVTKSRKTPAWIVWLWQRVNGEHRRRKARKKHNDEVLSFLRMDVNAEIQKVRKRIAQQAA